MSSKLKKRQLIIVVNNNFDKFMWIQVVQFMKWIQQKISCFCLQEQEQKGAMCLCFSFKKYFKTSKLQIAKKTAGVFY